MTDIHRIPQVVTMKFAMARKLQMTQIFDEHGAVHPVTVVSVEPMRISLLRTKATDGYDAVQVTYGVSGKSRGQKEFRDVDGSTKDMKIGTEINPVESFSPGDVVRVSSKSKGKGFQGVVKRYGFAGGPRTHGQKHAERKVGSIGSGGIARVLKGKRMPGRMGGGRVTTKGSTIVSVDKDKGLFAIRGSIPGRRGGIVEIQSV